MLTEIVVNKQGKQRDFPTPTTSPPPSFPSYPLLEMSLIPYAYVGILSAKIEEKKHHLCEIYKLNIPTHMQMRPGIGQINTENMTCLLLTKSTTEPYRKITYRTIEHSDKN